MELSNSEKIIKNELKRFVKEWRTKHPSVSSGVLKDSDLIEFVNDLQSEILNKTSFIPPSGNKLILYSGKNANGEDLWKEMGDFCKRNSDYYYINSTEAGKILWENDFKEEVINAIGDRYVAERVLSGKDYATNKRISKFAIEGTDILAMDDFVSYALTKTAIDNGYSVFYVAGKGVSAADKKVGILTELPCVISETWIGKTVDEAMANKFVVVDDLNKLLSPDLSEYSDIFIRNSDFLLDDKGIIRGVHLEMNDFPSIDVGKTSGYASSINYGSKLGILTDSGLFSKYSFLNDSVSQSILDEFRVGEYKLKTTGVDTLTSKSLYFDNSGLLVSIEKKVPNSVFETTIGDMRKFRPDAEISKLLGVDFENLSELEKLQLRQYDLEFRNANNILDSIEVDNAIKSKYLSNVGKTEETAGILDKWVIKLLDGKLKGNDDAANALVKLASYAKKLPGKLAKVIPYVGYIFDLNDIVNGMDTILEAYEIGGQKYAIEVGQTLFKQMAFATAETWLVAELSSSIIAIGSCCGPWGFGISIVAALGLTVGNMFFLNEVQKDFNESFDVNDFLFKPVDGDSPAVYDISDSYWNLEKQTIIKKWFYVILLKTSDIK